MKRVLVALAALIGSMFAIFTVATPPASAGCGPGSPGYCRFMDHNPTYNTPSVIDVGFRIRCGGYSTAYWLFELENTIGICPGGQSLSGIDTNATNAQTGYLALCRDEANGGEPKFIGHSDGTWHNFPVPPPREFEWRQCHKVDVFGRSHTRKMPKKVISYVRDVAVLRKDLTHTAR